MQRFFFLFAVSFNFWMHIFSSSAGAFYSCFVYYIALQACSFYFNFVEYLYRMFGAGSFLVEFIKYFLYVPFTFLSSCSLSHMIFLFLLSLFTLFVVYVSAAENRLILELFRNYSCHFVEESFIGKILMYRMTKCLYNVD